MEDTRSLGELFLPIPGSDHVLHTRVECAFGKTDEKAQGVDGFRVIGAAETEGQNSPRKLPLLVRTFQ
jgi:hypothetical protein